jgi:hypothetical protein
MDSIANPKAKLPGHRPGLPGNVVSFYIVPLDPAYKAGLAGHIPVNDLILIVIDLLCNFNQKKTCKTSLYRFAGPVINLNFSTNHSAWLMADNCQG